MSSSIVLGVVARLMTPFILMYGLYVQLHGEYSPGGGFQAGVILATVFILHGLLYGTAAVGRFIPQRLLVSCAALGILIYSGTGALSLAQGGHFLNYSTIGPDPVSGQKLGIMLVEAGVGLTVFAAMSLLFVLFAGRAEE